MLAPSNTKSGEEYPNAASDEVPDEAEELSAWMQEHKLPKKMQQKLLEEEVTIDVLLISTENDIRSLCKEFGLNRLATMKLLAAVKKMPDAKLNKRSKIIIMDFQEKDAMNKTEAALSVLSNSLKCAQTGVETLAVNADKTREAVTFAFIEIRKRINKREEQLMLRVAEVKDKQITDLKNDALRFQQYIEKVKNAIKLQNDLFEQNLTADARKQKVLQYKDDAIDANFNYDLTENEQLLFCNANENELCECVIKYGLVDGCFKVRLPTITAIEIVQRNNISIAWFIPESDAIIMHFEIQHSLKENAEETDWTLLEYKPTNKVITTHTYAITCLKYSCAYYIRVRGSNKYGNGPFSATKTLKTLAQPIPNEPVWCEDYPQLDGNLNIKLQWKVIFDDEEAKENTTLIIVADDESKNNDEIKVDDDDSKDDGQRKVVKRYSNDCEIVQFEIQFSDTVSNIWKTVFVDRLVESGNQVCEHRLEKLKETTPYKMRIRCKNRVNEWSTWGPESTLKTLQGITQHCFVWDEINPSPPAPINITQGGRRIEAPDASCWETFIGSSVAMSSGKHIWKMRWNKFGGSYQAMAIVTNVRCVDVRETNHRFNNNTTKYGHAYFWHRDGQKIAYANDGSETDLKTSIDKWQTGDVITVRLDLDANTIQFERNSTDLGSYPVKAGFTWHALILMCTCGNEAESVPVSEW